VPEVLADEMRRVFSGVQSSVRSYLGLDDESNQGRVRIGAKMQVRGDSKVLFGRGVLLVVKVRREMQWREGQLLGGEDEPDTKEGKGWYVVVVDIVLRQK